MDLPKPSNIVRKEIAEVLEKEDGMDPTMADVISKLIMSDDSSEDSDKSSSSSGNSDSKILESDSDVPKRYKSRRTFPRRKQEDSNWFKRYLTEEARSVIKGDPTHRDTLEFKGLFRVSYEVFEDIITVFNEEQWYESRIDCCKRPNSRLELLVLGALFKLGNGNGRWVAQSDTNISKETHRRFFKEFIRHIASIRHRYIYMPRNDAEVQEVCRLYSDLGLPGCVGSIDVVHIGWDACPANMLHLYKGKESYPSIAYEVIVNQKRFIMSVTVGHPGARNDKHICRLDESLRHLAEGWLSKVEWWAYSDMANESKIVVVKGLYLICDGGYLRWPTLICPVKVTERFKKLSKVIESTRKDVEDVFGMLANQDQLT